MSSLEIYPDRESKTLEFKRSLPAFTSLIKTCVAFANTAGGQIIIGVADGSREVIGVSSEDRERLYEGFPSSLYDASNNGLFAHVYERNLNDKSVMVIEVPLSANRPCFVKKEGLPNGVYLRVGASTRRAQEAHVTELMRESRHQYFDAESTQAEYHDLSKSALENCYGQNYSLKKLESDAVIARRSPARQDYVGTVAGVLMFNECPERYIPEAMMLCTEFSGTAGRDITQTREIKGVIPQIINEGCALLGHWLERNLTLKGVRLVGKTLVPMNALREAITNALLHRKYTTPGAVKVALYDDRLEVFSPGAFPGLVDIDNLGDGTTYLRNPHLAMIARRLKLVEKLGTGIKLIFDSCKKHGLKEPKYFEDGDFVKVVFYFAPAVDVGATDEEAILNYLSFREEAKISDIMTLLDCSRNTATRKLNTLIEENRVIRKGSGPAVRYVKRSA